MSISSGEAIKRLKNGEPYRLVKDEGITETISWRNDGVRADFSQSVLASADFSGSILMGTTFEGTRLDNCNFTNSDLAGCDFNNATFNGGDFAKVRNAHLAKNLHTIRITHFPNNSFNLDDIHRPWWVRTDWELLKVFGRLPLFTASTTTLVLLPIFFYFFDLYDRHLSAWQAAAKVRPDSTLISEAISRLPTAELPSLLLWALVSATLLLIASLAYTRCPGRVQQFSRHQWVDELKRPMLEYWPHAWRYPALRMLCLFCYIVGGGIAAWIILCKLFSAFAYIINRSDFAIFG